MLPVPHHRQSSGYCGPASLKMVLGFYGVDISEPKLAKLAGSSRLKGTSAKGLIAAAKKVGFRGSIKDNATIADLRKLRKRGIPVIVNWFSTETGHYSVVADVTKTHVVLRDPEWDGPHSIDIPTFLGIWFDFHGAYPKTKADMILRRMIVVEPA